MYFTYLIMLTRIIAICHPLHTCRFLPTKPHDLCWRDFTRVSEHSVESCWPLVAERLVVVKVSGLHCGVSYWICYFGVSAFVQVFLNVNTGHVVVWRMARELQRSLELIERGHWSLFEGGVVFLVPLLIVFHIGTLMTSLAFSRVFVRLEWEIKFTVQPVKVSKIDENKTVR